MSSVATVRGALERLKVFPLPASVLLPGSGLPLHVFEPRYRALIEDALASDQVISVALLAPGWEENYEGRAALEPIAGAGLIEEFRRYPDGRLDVLVRGMMRVRFVGEHATDRDYRELRAEPYGEGAEADPGSADGLRACIMELTRALPEDEAEPLAHALAQVRDAGELCDFAAATLLEDAAVRQRVLEAADVATRVRVVEAELGQLLLRVPLPGGGGPAMA